MIYDYMPVSTVDYPGKIATTVFISGCNFRCPYCHNSSIVINKKANLTDEDILRYLDRRKNLIDGVCISGGEPTLWEGLKSLMVKIKSSGFLIKLDTNGSRPEVVQELIEEKLVDYIAMDVKAPLDGYRNFLTQVRDVEKVNISVDIIKNSAVDYEFRTTVHPRLLSIEDIKRIGQWLKGAKKYVLQGYRYSDGVLNPVLCGRQNCDKTYLEKARDEVVEYFDRVEIRL